MALWSNTDTEASKPKYLNNTDKAATLGITPDETANQKATHAGWVLTTTGSGGRAGRVFNETLVAMGSMTGDNDTVDPDPVITIGTQPSPLSVTSPTAATFNVVATATRSATLSYQWQYNTGSHVAPIWENITGETGTNLTISSTDPEYLNDAQFRVRVSAVGATTVNSSTVTLTIS